MGGGGAGQRTTDRGGVRVSQLASVPHKSRLCVCVFSLLYVTPTHASSGKINLTLYNEIYIFKLFHPEIQGALLYVSKLLEFRFLRKRERDDRIL